MDLRAEQKQAGTNNEATPISMRFSPLEEEQLNDPYALYALARKTEPIFFSPDIGAWVVTRYQDVRSILLQPEIFS